MPGSTSVLPLLSAMHLIRLFSWHYTYSIHLHQLAVDFHWCNTSHKNQNTLHTSVSAMVMADHPSLIWHTYGFHSYLYNNIIYVPIICLNLQSHGTSACQSCCYHMFWNFLVYLSEVENSKYGGRNTSTMGSTTGKNTDMPLILNNNHITGVTDEVREITWLYKQR